MTRVYSWKIFCRTEKNEGRTPDENWEDSSLCPETSTKNAVQEFHPWRRISWRWPHHEGFLLQIKPVLNSASWAQFWWGAAVSAAGWQSWTPAESFPHSTGWTRRADSGLALYFCVAAFSLPVLTERTGCRVNENDKKQVLWICKFQFTLGRSASFSFIVLETRLEHVRNM
jgi:hypothetical protein